MNFYNNSQILITGGTGSFREMNFAGRLWKIKLNLERLIIFSRDEFKQSEMEKNIL